MRLPSISSLERAHLCPPSQVYPHFRTAGNRWAARGKAIHHFLVRVAEVGIEQALGEVPPEYYGACAMIEVDLLPVATPDSYAYEVALAYDLETDTGRELARNVDREGAYADVGPNEVFGTVDVLALTETEVVIYDYKTGFKFFNRIEENFQLLGYALAACRAYGKEGAFLAIIRIDDEGHPYFLRGYVSLLELDAFAQGLRDLDETIADLQLRFDGGEELHPVTGDHCQYCPAVAKCPAWMALARNMTGGDELAGLPPIAADTAAQYVEALKRGKKVLGRIEKALGLYAEQSPIDLGGGWVYGPHPFPIDTFDVEKALPVLQGFLAEGAAGCIKATVLKKEIEDVYRERKKADKNVRIGKDTQTVLDALRNHGAVTTTYSHPIGIFKPKSPTADDALEAGLKANVEQPNAATESSDAA